MVLEEAVVVWFDAQEDTAFAALEHASQHATFHTAALGPLEP